MPDRIKKQEYDDGGPAVEGETEEEKAAREEKGRRIRVNPLLISLDDIPLDWILKGREGAVWHYSAVFRPEDPEKPETARWQIMLGSDKPLTIIPEEYWDYMLSQSAEDAAEKRLADPEHEVRILWPKDIDDLKRGISKLGHPTITVDWERGTGKTVEGEAAASGEFLFFPNAQKGKVTDKSGRYMSAKVRENLGLPVDPEDALKWGQEVAAAFSKKLGGIPVEFEQVRTAPKQVNEPVAAHATLLPTGGAQTTEAPGQPASASAPAAAGASHKRPAAHTGEQAKRRR
ncbi:hypothetical protein O7599_23085 [Streptomyces sp. WMMC500]|uniref:hypothetical protein n=1 Tax=Streptomyces sp. WMMC500 TaxID=3015154 RepID=UPI00248B5BC7|nr:hypothetical protein [Streptomyces sp. WMMC500]WBB58511.1 hypothetical protein O7599_23085 [Streptomyces sp. WMMC500]